jgi:hypothetical protein
MPFSEKYFRLFEDVPAFHDRVAQKYSPGSASTPISERLLRCVWYDRLYNEQQLATGDGRKIVVHAPGTWNLEGGPDFKRADITIGGSRLKGDVELHLDPAGWRQHQHSHDPQYDNVILHVTLTSSPKGPLPISRHGVEIPEVALWDCLTDDLKVLKCALRPDEYPYSSTQNFGRCREPLEEIQSRAAQRLLCIAGDARMVAKQRRFAYESERYDPDQVAYAAVLEGMGYKAYTKQFGQLAQRLPYARLRERVLFAGKNSRPKNVILLTQALLFGAAGLLPPPKGGDSSETKDYVKQLHRLWREYGFDDLADEDISWKASAVRPANLPQRRIAGISYILSRSYKEGMLASILGCLLKDDAKKARSDSIEYLACAEDDFWSHRYSAGGRRLAKPVSLVGRDRALTIVVNSFVPLGLLHARMEDRKGEEELVHQFYCGLPSLPPNNITRLMEYRMFGKSSKRRVARSARTQQGLLQIFADWCSEDPACESCGIFAALQSGYFTDKIMDSGQA